MTTARCGGGGDGNGDDDCILCRRYRHRWRYGQLLKLSERNTSRKSGQILSSADITRSYGVEQSQYHMQ